MIGYLREQQIVLIFDPASGTLHPGTGGPPFEGLRGFWIDGVDLQTSALPEGWRDRLVKVQNANTAAAGGGPQFTGWCLDKEDLCVAKLCVFREKDQNFVSALLRAGLVDPGVIAARLTTVPEQYRPSAARAAEWLGSSA